jgi:DNA replication protein DnaC
MLSEEAKRKLRLLNIGEYIEAVEMQEKDPTTMGMPFEDRFQMATDHVYQCKNNARVKNLIKNAKFRLPNADVHDILYVKGRPLSRESVLEASTCDFVDNNKSVIIQGYPSSGKTFLACAIGKETCRCLYRTRYVRVPDLLDEFNQKSLTPGGKLKVLTKYSNFKVLILDEWLTRDTIYTREELDFLFELSERRYNVASTIFCSLRHHDEWVRFLGGGTYAESIAERYKYNVISFETGDKNMRAIYGA